MSADMRLDHRDILWLTAGLGCDGDTTAITAVRPPSPEALIHGAEAPSDLGEGLRLDDVEVVEP